MPPHYGCGWFPQVLIYGQQGFYKSEKNPILDAGLCVSFLSIQNFKTETEMSVFNI